MAQAPAGPVSSDYVPQRVYDTRRAAFADFEMMAADVARADVVLIGEQHDDPNSHRLELAVLEALARRQVAVTLSLEMFERDVQTSVDAYLSGSSTEDDFLKNGRPWPRYATDYRPLVEFAKRQRWPVVAANVPRRIAADAARTGKAAIDALTTTDRSLVAADLQCPHDTYFDRFAEQTERPGRVKEINRGLVPGTAEKARADGTAVLDFFGLEIRYRRPLHHRTKRRDDAGRQEDRFGQ